MNKCPHCNQTLWPYDKARRKIDRMKEDILPDIDAFWNAIILESLVAYMTPDEISGKGLK